MNIEVNVKTLAEIARTIDEAIDEVALAMEKITPEITEATLKTQKSEIAAALFDVSVIPSRVCSIVCAALKMSREDFEELAKHAPKFMA